MARHHDLLSDLELHVLWYLQQLDPVDIREQKPLLLDGLEPEFEWHELSAGTLHIAKVLGVRHPMVVAGTPFQMTTDFLLTLRGGLRVAVHVKFAEELDEEGNAELRRIEEEYWRRRGVRLIVITEQDIDRVAVGNLAMCASVDKDAVGEITEAWLVRVCMEAQHATMKSALQCLASQTGIEYGVAVNRVKIAILKGHLRLDLTRGVLRWDDVWPPMRVTALSAISCNEVHDG
jgi:hypothetical protein